MRGSKRLALFVAAGALALAAIAPAAHAFTFTSKGGYQGWPNASTTLTITLPSALTSGGYAVLAVYENSGETQGTLPTVVDSGGVNTWSSIATASCHNPSGPFDQLTVYGATIISTVATSGTVTITFPNSGEYVGANLIYITGQASSSVVDKANCNKTSVSGTSISTSALTPANASEGVYIIGVSKGASGAASITSPSVTSPPIASPFASNIGTTGVGGTATLAGSPATTGTLTYPTNTAGIVSMVLLNPSGAPVPLPMSNFSLLGAQ